MDKLRHWFWTRLNFLLRHAGMLLAPPPPMTACVVTVRPDRRRYRIDNEGFTLIEIMMTLVIAGVLTAVALPMFQNASKSYRLSSAVLAVTGAIQTTRYQAIMHGCPYTLSIDPTSRTYQVQSEPPGASSFSNVGTAVPWATSGAITLSP
ncbi:MAG TPA: prepilin-type N-terminal cleavage/methylation domain-containing protein, partial [Terriglobia bacterium]|nr:prepilin-type N-terminal cleavage/methylation domain-containing protein [Terriglobia bacterium]